MTCDIATSVVLLSPPSLEFPKLYFWEAGCLSSVPHSGDLGIPHLALKLEDAVHQSLTGRRAAGDVDVDGDDTVAATDDTVGVVVVATTVGAGAHGDDPSGLGHLIVDLAQGGGHLVGEGAGDNHDIGLTGRGTENDTETILIVTGSRQVHHFDGAAGETKGHGPEGGLTSPVGDAIESSAVKVNLLAKETATVERKVEQRN